VVPEFAWAGSFGTMTTGLPYIGAIPRHPRIHAVMAMAAMASPSRGSLPRSSRPRSAGWTTRMQTRLPSTTGCISINNPSSP